VEAVTLRYYALSDALQYLGNVAFREPVPLTNIRCGVSAFGGENPQRSDAL